jgi:hypothetical protein
MGNETKYDSCLRCVIENSYLLNSGNPHCHDCMIRRIIQSKEKKPGENSLEEETKSASEIEND